MVKLTDAIRQFQESDLVLSRPILDHYKMRLPHPIWFSEF